MKKTEMDEAILEEYLSKKRGRPEGSGWMEKPTLITFNVEAGLKEGLKELAYSKRVTVSELLRRICEEAVAKHFGLPEVESGE